MSLRGNAAQAYDAYKANWIAENGEVPALVIHSMWTDEGKAIEKLLYAATGTKTLGQVYRRYPVVILEDGRAVEPSVDTRGCWIYVVFENVEKALGYKCPMSIHEMYGWW